LSRIKKSRSEPPNGREKKIDERARTTPAIESIPKPEKGWRPDRETMHSRTTRNTERERGGREE
jgi:hypothetical protein